MQVSLNELNQQTEQWVNRAEQSRDCVVVTAHDGQARAVLIGIDTFTSMLGIQDRVEQAPLSVAELQQGLRQALAEAGYETRDEIVALVKDVRRELAAERAETKAVAALPS